MGGGGGGGGRNLNYFIKLNQIAIHNYRTKELTFKKRVAFKCERRTSTESHSNTLKFQHTQKRLLKVTISVTHFFLTIFNCIALKKTSNMLIND